MKITLIIYQIRFLTRLVNSMQRQMKSILDETKQEMELTQMPDAQPLLTDENQSIPLGQPSPDFLF